METDMWQRFTERARRVVFFAQEEAGRLGENYVRKADFSAALLAKCASRFGRNDGIFYSERKRQGDG